MKCPPYALILGGLFLLPAVASCSGGGSEEEPAAEAAPADALSRREKDSIISTMPIPGAGAVGRALRAADSAQARAQVHDSLARLP